MDMKDLDKYQLKEIVYAHDESYEEMIAYLLSILLDRSIPEENKRDIQKQYDEIMRLKSITMKPPVIIIEPKE